MANLVSELEALKSENVKRWTLCGLDTIVKCTRVLDGDTCELVFFPDFANSSAVKVNARLLGIDTPEIHTKDLEEKKCGLKCTEYLKTLIEGKILYAHFGNAKNKEDKYGRQLVTLWLQVHDSDLREQDFVLMKQFENEIDPLHRNACKWDALAPCVNILMLGQTGCVPYHGKKKIPFQEREIL